MRNMNHIIWPILYGPYHMVFCDIVCNPTPVSFIKISEVVLRVQLADIIGSKHWIVKF